MTATGWGTKPDTSDKPKGLNLKVTLMWAQLDTVNEMSGKYQVDLCELSPAAIDKLEERGIEVHRKEGKGAFITTKSTRTIKAYLDGEEFTGRIGNGTKAVATVTPYSWDFKGKSGVSPSLQRLVITDLVEFEGGDGGVELEYEEAF